MERRKINAYGAAATKAELVAEIEVEEGACFCICPGIRQGGTS